MRKRSPVDWHEEKIAELEAQLGRGVSNRDLDCVDINEHERTMTVARDPLLSEIRTAENARNQQIGSNPELR